MARIYQYNALSTELEPVNHLSSNKDPTIENIMALKHDRARIQYNGIDISDLLYPRVERIHADEARHKELLKQNDFAQLVEHKNKPTALSTRGHWDPDIKKKALQMARQGRSGADIALSLNIPANTLYKWTYHAKIPLKGKSGVKGREPVLPGSASVLDGPVPMKGTTEFRQYVLAYQDAHPEESISKIGRKFDFSPSSLWYWRKDAERGSAAKTIIASPGQRVAQISPKGGKPITYTEEDKQRLFEFIEKNPHMSHKEACEKFGIKPGTLAYWRNKQKEEAAIEARKAKAKERRIEAQKEVAVQSVPTWQHSSQQATEIKVYPIDPLPTAWPDPTHCARCAELEAELKTLREDAALFKKLLIKELK